MRLGGRAQAAIEVLDDIETRRRPAADALRDWGLSHRFAGSGDRAIIGNLVYDTLRRRASQAWRMDADGSPALVFATLIGQWGHAPEALSAAFADDRFAPEMPEPARLAVWREKQLDDAPDWVRADVPQWCVPQLQRSFSTDWVAEAAALGERAPLDLRVNTLKADRGKVEKQLRRLGVRQGGFVQTALRIEHGSGEARLPNVQAEAGFQKGWFEVQDQASQAVAVLARARPGEQVLDYCAGAGGKTLALAAAMKNRGQIHAYDTDRNRLAPIHERLKRAGVRNVQVLAPHQPLDHLAEKMDLVFVDAPCTGSGVWRRRPDAKWRVSPQQLEQRMAEQAAILSEAAGFVKPGGRLCYVTCSLFADENVKPLGDFLQKRPDWQQADSGQAWGACFGETELRPRFAGGGLLLSPAATATDGFFFASLERRI